MDCVGRVAPVLLLVMAVPVWAENSRPPMKPAASTNASASKTVPATAMRDCGTDEDCIIQASRDCSAAKGEITRSIELFGVKQSTTSSVEIRRASDSTKCIYYFRTGKTDLTFPSSVAADVVKRQKELYKNLEGKWGSCKFNKSDLTAMLTRWKAGSVSSDDLQGKNCEGPFFSARLDMKDSKPVASKSRARSEGSGTKHIASKKSSHPPRQLHLVGDHWTAYNPPDPTTYPAGAKTYAIKAGDTLWGVATQFFKNGYLWPQVWESNTWITDAHWIYPGDVLLVEGEAAQAAQQSATVTSTTATLGSSTSTTQTGTTATAARQPTAGMLITAADAVGGTAFPVALGTDADIYCYGYIGDPQEPMPNSVHSYEDVEVRYEAGAVRQEIGGATGDLVYLNGGTSTGLVAGETYIVIRPDEMITRPGSNQLVGRHYQYTGQIRVLCAEETRSRGIITQACSDVTVGSKLRPMPQIPIPLARIPSLPAWCDAASGKTTGNIVHAQGGTWLNALGEGQLVQVNLGRDDQIQPGDFLTVFRDSPQPGQARQVLGEIGILTTEGHTATGKIVLMRYSMKVGDNVEIR